MFYIVVTSRDLVNVMTTFLSVIVTSAYDLTVMTYYSVSFVSVTSRRHLFYVINVIMPSLMTSVLLLSIFFCTPAQKVQIGVVVLLSFRIFLLNVAGNIPKTSDHVPLLGEPLPYYLFGSVL